MNIEEALIELIAQLEHQDFDEQAQRAGTRVFEAISQAEPRSVDQDSHRRIKQLYALALAQLDSHHKQLREQIKRTSEARHMLGAVKRVPQTQASDCDIAG